MSTVFCGSGHGLFDGTNFPGAEQKRESMRIVGFRAKNKTQDLSNTMLKIEVKTEM